MSKLISTLRLITSIALCQAAGLIGSLFTVSEIGTWYSTLLFPAFAPPGWVFGPVWTTLYTLMGIALFLLWNAPRSRQRHLALVAFFIQLGLNAIWSPIFFGAHALAVSVVVIVLLLIAIILTMAAMYKVRPAATYLFVPYVLWVGFATILNIAIWRLN